MIQNEFFKPFTNTTRNNYVNRRYDLNQEDEEYLNDGSVQFGQVVETASTGIENLPDDVKYALIGIPEDIGVRANLGREGASEAWIEFLKAFLAFQHSDHNDPGRFCVLGEVQVEDLIKKAHGLDASNHTDRRKLSSLVAEVDERVYQVCSWIKTFDLTPIFIGGGHNNCYPVLKALGESDPIDCINIDAHTDLRSPNGRHSGNGFSHALKDGVLGYYFMLGLNQNYLSLPMRKQIQDNQNLMFKDLASVQSDPEAAVSAALNFVNTNSFGLEIDMDVVADFPSSAQSPLGINFKELTRMVDKIQNQSASRPKYIHICEAAPRYGYSGQAGKALAHLVNLFK
jgi:formiminoglutamase